MIEAEDILIIAKSVAGVMRDYVAACMASVIGRVDAVEQNLKAIPEGRCGKDGEPGRDGEKGDTGEQGPQGEPGPVGPAGPIGPEGKTGPQGERGEKGEPGAIGEKGIDGKDGRDGRDGIGKDGRDGEPGRDALQIEILPMIDPAKSYPRGTFAKLEGGLARAVRNTSPLAEASTDRNGWEMVIDGIAHIKGKRAESLRDFSICIRMASGEEIEFPFSVPAMIYRGIFKEGAEYKQGDTVTYGGSTWHCNAETTKARPGTNTDFQMMVKEGRAGKDGQRGEKGDKGDPGRDGRDLTQMNKDGRKY